MNKSEYFKDIIGYEGLYQISNYGRIKSLPKPFHPYNKNILSKETILKTRFGRGGYVIANLNKSGIKKNNKSCSICCNTFYLKSK